MKSKLIGISLVLNQKYSNILLVNINLIVFNNLKLISKIFNYMRKGNNFSNSIKIATKIGHKINERKFYDRIEERIACHGFKVLSILCATEKN